MNVQMLKRSDKIIFECISGSHAYGTNIEGKSDLDIRGLYSLSKRDHLSLIELPQEVSDDKQDIKYYELKKFFDLAKDCNPNILELLYMPEDCISIQTPIMDKILANKHLFVSAKAFHTHSGYAYAQIGKARGKNKFVNNPKSKEPPVKEDFCLIITDFDGEYRHLIEDRIFPMRPIKLADYNKSGRIPIDLSKCHVSAVEHITNTYRLYDYGDEGKGVFRGDDMLVVESIPLEDDLSWKSGGKFIGILIYNEALFNKSLNEWKSYWKWIENRNEARWVDQENGKLDFDQKNMLHCVRLLLSGMNILTNGEPIVRFSGDQLKYLRDIRAGIYSYDYIMGQVESMMKEFEELKESTKLPWSVDLKAINELYLDIMDEIG